MPHVVPVPAAEQLASPPRHRAAGPDFWCVRQDVGGRAAEVRLVLSGELDLATAPELDRELRSAQRHALRVVVDLRQLTFMDCAGLHVLLEAAQRARASAARFFVVAGSPHIDQLLALTDIEVQTPDHRHLVV